ncbi:uncharacterized protein LOC120079036 [Benincasa hispida]|uniref:uncharacterized protein LOC120079036 n=1 Tax=Benincasa hispida TaxID=102211 RepID=UPI0019028380|nr:uncharacterized protein LOC120079036 [Benincasa hispida]
MVFKMNWNFIFLVFSFTFCPFVNSLQGNDSISMDAFLKETAFKTLVRRRPYTGALYQASLPANLSGMEVSVVRLRSRRLWDKGVNFSHFGIPSNTLPVPHVRRLVIVYQDFGNWSSSYFKIPGFSLLTPVIGFMVFNATSNTEAKNITKLSIATMENRIEIHFPNLKFRLGKSSNTMCAEFDEDGIFHLTQMESPDVCYSRKQGYFAVVSKLKRKKKTWYLWVIGFVLGVGGLVVAGYAAMVTIRALKTKKIQIMEKQADEDLVLQSRWVGNSKMPSAAVTRTMPVLENSSFP